MSRALTWVARPSVLVSLVVLIAGFQIVRAVTTERPTPPPVLGEVANFALTDQSGRDYRSTYHLAGRVWIASFVQTRCGEACPVVDRLFSLQDSIKNASPYLHIISFAVDPEHDGPRQLSAFSHERGASRRMWTWLTGERGSLTAVLGSFDVEPGAPTLALVDQRMRIRGYYDATDGGQVDAMLRDAAVLLNFAEE